MAQECEDGDLVILFRAPKEGDPVDPYVKAVESCKRRAVCVPVLAFKYTNLQALREALCKPEAYSGLILTSPRAVTAVAKATDHTDWAQSHSPMWSKLPTFVVGHATKLEAKRLGLATLGEESGSAETLVPHILQRAPPSGPPLLFPCGNLSGETIPAALHEHAILVTCLAVYETIPAAEIRESLRKVIDAHGQPSCLVFYSPSGVRFTWPELKAQGLDSGHIDFVAIGATTRRALLDQGVEAASVAAKPTPEGLKEAILSLSQRQA